MFFPGIMPRRKASLPNPWSYVTIQTSSIHNSKVQVNFEHSHRKNNKRLNTEASQSYRGKKSTNSPQKTKAEFKSNNLTSFYQKHLTCFDQQKQTIKLQKERKEVPETNQKAEPKVADKNGNKLYFIVKRKHYLLNLSKKTKHDTINSQRNNKTEVVAKQTPNKKEIHPQQQSNKSKRYVDLSLNQIIQAQCPKWRFSLIRKSRKNQKQVYGGW